MCLFTRHVDSVHGRVDLRAHALWYLVMVVVVMELWRGGDGGEKKWRVYSLCVCVKCIMRVLKDVRILLVVHERRDYGT